MSSTRRDLLAGVAGGAALGTLSGCMTTNVATGRTSYTGLYDISDDIEIGQREHPKMLESFGGEYQSSRLASYVSRIGGRLAAHTEYQQFPYRFTLLNTPIVNAFALPGGFVYVSRGLLTLASNEAELAGVLAHELGHVNARHAAERLSAAQAAQVGVIAGAIGAAVLGLPGDVARLGQGIAALSIQGYSRKQEFEADMLGVRYMSRAGYEPEGMVTFLGTLREQSVVEARSLGLPPGKVDEYNMMSTHPRTVDRVRQAAAAAAVQRPPTPRVGREDYLHEIDGVLFGDDPAQGIVIGRRVVHPALGFEFRVPTGFRVENSPEKIVARDDSGAAVIFDMAPLRRAADMPAYLRDEWGPNARLRDIERLTVNGLDAGTAWVPAEGPGGVPMDLRLVAIRRDARSAYRLVMISPRNRTAALRQEFQDTTFSFRTLGAAEAAAVRPLHLAVERAAPGDTVERLSAPLPYGRYNADWFRVMNDLAPGAQPEPGQVLKVVRG
jgi:predicted Zn-dependent protease